MRLPALRQENRDLVLRALMSWVCAGHFATGVLALISGDRAIRLGGRFYQADFTPTKQFEIILRPLGAYMLALAFLQAKAIADPARYKAVVDATLLVFLLRQIQRSLYARDVQSAFGISPQSHAITSWYFRLIGAALLFARFAFGRR